MKYNVRISEELARTIEIEAEDENEAYNKTYDMYRDCKVVLTSDDYVGEPDIRVGNPMTLGDAICTLNRLNYSVTFLCEDDVEDNNESIFVECPDGHNKYLPSYEALITFAEEKEAK